MNRLSTKVLNTQFKNPIITASGTFGYGYEYKDYYEPSLLGGIASKGITWNKKDGNTGIRIWETPCGILNSIGLENPGVSTFIEKYLKDMQSLDTNILINLGGNTIDDYIKGVIALNDYDFFAIELNISCPNVKNGGMAFGTRCENAKMVVDAVRKATKHNLIVKLSPQADDIVEVAKAVENAGADGISLVNTFLAMAIDVENLKNPFDNIYAGLSGSAIKPIALRMVHQVCKNVSIPVIGMGGITTGKDALEFIMAGASLVQVGTANFINPLAPVEIIKEMDEFLTRKNLTIDKIRGII